MGNKDNKCVQCFLGFGSDGSLVYDRRSRGIRRRQLAGHGYDMLFSNSHLLIC